MSNQIRRHSRTGNGAATFTTHATKGRRRASDSRVKAKFLMDTIFYIAGLRANGRRTLRAGR